MWIWLFFIFLLSILVYLLVAYSLRWYDLSNRPEYFQRRIQPPKLADESSPPAAVILGSFLLEYFYTFVHVLLLVADYLLLPVQSILPAGSKPPNPDDPRFVILVHGFMMRGGVMRWLKLRLNHAGWRNVYIFTYAPPWKDIPHFAGQLNAFIEELAIGEPDLKFDLVCHSMGGLVARYYIHELGGSCRVRNMVTLGTPHQGSNLWGFALGASGIQICPRNPWLIKLAGHKPKGYRLTCIYSDFDELVIPYENASLPLFGVENKLVNYVGHVGLVFNHRVVELVCKALGEG